MLYLSRWNSVTSLDTLDEYPLIVLAAASTALVEPSMSKVPRAHKREK